MRLLGDPHLAEECVAETFSRLLTVLRNGGGPEENLSAYLYRTAHNWIIDCYRQKSRVQPIDPECLAGDESDPHQQVDRSIVRQRVRAALLLLTTDQRQVIALKYLEGLNNEVIARVVDRPVGAVKSLQHRGLAALRRILKNELEDVS